jgi:hypothetical protein
VAILELIKIAAICYNIWWRIDSREPFDELFRRSDMLLFRNHLILILFAILFIALNLSACNMPGFHPASPSSVGSIQTAAAQTVQAQLTRDSQVRATLNVSTPLLPVSPTVSLPSLSPTTPPATFLPPTQTQVPKTPTPVPCDRVNFVQDVTIPDNSEFAPGTVFVKTWRLQNAGSCTWTSAYSLVPDGENVFNAPALVPLTTGTVSPGGAIDVSVTLTAPVVAGTYRGNFKIANPSGQRFAMGDGAKPFWAQVKVIVAGGITFDFVAQASQAEWKSGSGNNLDTPISFDGADDDPNGVAKIVNNVQLESGGVSGKVLLTFPKHVNTGLISGVFPPYLVQAGDFFKARLGFIANPDGTCGNGQVKFQVYFKEGSISQLLGEWNKTCDGTLLSISVDLSSLKGRTIQIMFVVKANGDLQDDWAIWNSPRIVR